MPTYARSVEELFRAPHDQFVAERKRLAAALRAGGDDAGAKRLAGLRRPTTSAWTVNQLWWTARDAFDAMLDAAARVRKGSPGATGDYRAALAALRKRAASVLAAAGHGASDAILRRVAATLSALAANGGFDPDPPGALIVDRDPPGFEALEGRSLRAARAAAAHERPRGTHAAVPPRVDPAAERKRRQAAEAAERAEKKRRDQEEARRTAERHRVETRLRTARIELTKRERALAGLRRDLGAAEKAVADARTSVAALERARDGLGRPV
jgi:hypothetical protein